MPSRAKVREQTTQIGTDTVLPALAMTHGEIAQRAYNLFLSRGGEHGHDLEDWLQAEHELSSVILVPEH